MATPTLAQTVLDAIESRLVGLHTFLPGHVVKVDVAAGKCDVQPDIKRVGADGVAKTLPPIPNCPINAYRAGLAAVYLPVKVGDKVAIKFCERSLDIWLTTGGTVDPNDARKHHLSDAVVYPGMYDFSDPPVGADPTKLVIVNDRVKILQDPSGLISIVNAAGTMEMSEDGRFKFQGADDELMTVVISLLTLLIGAVTLDPLTGPMPTFITTQITQLQLIKAKLEGLKI